MRLFLDALFCTMLFSNKKNNCPLFNQEMLIHHITKEAHKQNSKGNMLEYKHLAEVVQTSEPLEFLREIMPRKITVRQFKELMAAKEHDSSSDSDSDSQSEDSSSSSNSSEGKNGEYKGSGAAAKENGKSESSKSTSSEESSEDN